MSEQLALDGSPPGKRIERTEWGIRNRTPNPLLPGDDRVQPCANRKHAEDIARWSPRYTNADYEILRRTVVVIESSWEPA